VINKITNILKSLFYILSSKAFLLWLIGGWLLYYVCSAIWIDEAFAFFVSGVKKNIIVQIPFVLFLICGYLNLIRILKDKFKNSKLGFISWFMLSIGVMLYFSGFFLSMTVRQSDNRLVGVGDVVRFPWSAESYRISEVTLGLKDHFRKSGFSGLLDSEPQITITDSSSNAYEVGAYPPARIGGTYSHILNFGLAPGIRFYKNDMLITEGYMALRLFPPGKSDFFELQPHPYRFLVNLAPELTDHGGHHPEPVFDLNDPVYSTRVFSGEKIVAEGNSGESINFDEFGLQFSKHIYWIQLESAKDPGVPVMKFGIFIFIFGVPIYLLRLVISVLSLRT
jgi:hypothetical protein